MCVITYIPKGVETPQNSLFWRIYQFNPHGIGIATPNEINKTLSYKTFTKLIEQRTIDQPCIVHFRFATHGSVSIKNCHPFYDKKTDIVFAHNGVLPIESVNDRTDSEIFFRQIAMPLFNTYGILNDNALYQIDQQRHGSRFIFMHDTQVVMQGDFTEIDGVYFSNTRFLTPRIY